MASARNQCGASVEVIGSIPVDDCWMRDSGPIFRIDAMGHLDAIGLNFNGWGGKQPHANDALVASRVAAHLGLAFTAAGITAEGGAIETGGGGTLLATSSSIVNTNRNMGMTYAQVESALTTAFGASKVIWFKGIAGKDITDDHVDATSRFLKVGEVLVQWPPDAYMDLWSRDARDQYRTLASATDALGAAMKVSKIAGPSREAIRQKSPDFVSSYANYYVCNGAMIAPQFGDEHADAAAKATLAELYHGYAIEQLDIDFIGNGGGGIHCVTQQEPLPIRH